MTEVDLAKAVNDKLRSAGLLGSVVPGKQQLFRHPNGSFIELVLRDASKLEAVENVIAAIRSAIEQNGIHLVPIVRALWEVGEVKKRGTSRGQSGGVEAATVFTVILKSVIPGLCRGAKLAGTRGHYGEALISG
jgi:hypothetical protein